MPETFEETRETLRILSIEDDYEYAYLLKEMLAAAWNAPFDLVHSDRLSIGKKQLDTETFDLILLDLSLPDSWGFDTFANVYSQASGVPIIVLSGLSDEKLAVRAVQEGARDYLVKGQVDANQLRQAIYCAVEHCAVEHCAVEHCAVEQSQVEEIS